MNLIRRRLARMKHAASSFFVARKYSTKNDTNTGKLHVYNAMFNIPSEFGGMVNSMLRRINGFVRYGSHLSMTILTFEGNSNPDATRRNLVERGLLGDGVGVRNIWVDLQALTDDELDSFRELSHEAVKATVSADELNCYKSPKSLIENESGPSADGKSYEEYYRDDGTLIALNILDGQISENLLLYSAAGRLIAVFETIESLYREWVRSVIGKDPSLLIVDDKKVSEFVYAIAEREFRMVLFMHGSHLRRPYDGPHGESLTNRTNTMRNIERFDVIATQTGQQADAIAAKGIDRRRLKYLPSELSFAPDPSAVYAERDDLSGVIVARLSKLKRVDHAISAIAMVNDFGINAHLTAFGKGPELENLRRYSCELEIENCIEFAGHVSDLPEQLRRQSFSLLTSTSEGFGLAIIESMAVGCVPITYDINYGPRDVISNGVDGYVVPFGDRSALAQAITEFLALDADAKMQMRFAAIKKSMSYLPKVSYERWAKVLREFDCAEFSNPLVRSGPALVEKFTVRSLNGSVHLELRFDSKEKIDRQTVQLLFASRSKNVFFQVNGHNKQLDSQFDFVFPHERFSQSIGQTFDLFIRPVGAIWESKRRLKLPEGFETANLEGERWFRTKYGNSSVKIVKLK